MRNEFLIIAILLLAAIGGTAYVWPPILWSLVLFGPLLLLGFIDFFQKGSSIRRNFPLLGRGRHFAELLRPKIRQYFIESDIDGRPFNRLDREVVYARSEQGLDTNPFGTQVDVYQEGYEWIAHSIGAKDPHKMDHHPKVTVGGPQCTKPYDCSLFNVSAMSYGSLSSVAIEALNAGAAIGGFAHNTGEGGISPYHLNPKGDLIWQIGTGYFGCRNKDGSFSPEAFRETASPDSVKMIEIKLSQGAKPGHGGILPGKKVTDEIAKIRLVEKGKTVFSPPFHTTFSNPIGLLEYVQQLRDLTGGKPIGFKLCVGNKSEFIGICKAMLETGIYPDFISVDGGEGGTGAAPLEFSDSVGMPMRSGLAFIYDTLVGFDLKKHIKINASGKIVTAFHMYRAMALGADYCSSARAMMLALGCIQALECNKNSCPTGVATHLPELKKGLVVSDKKHKVANYHKDTMESFVELLAASGMDNPSKINRTHMYRRVSVFETRRFDDYYPYIELGSLLKEPYPESFIRYMKEASSNLFTG
ncbi:MAG: FMN-binding glutamate synthase family protein [Bacteroidota bacterium]